MLKHQNNQLEWIIKMLSEYTNFSSAIKFNENRIKELEIDTDEKR